ncbi:MAG: gliding motility-associated C-terminal domain-containing protein [Bacteroidales bacterium]|jgi:gliding motility-associated-like protein
MKSFFKIVISCLLLVLSFNAKAQDNTVYDTTYATICSNEYFSNDIFDSISIRDTSSRINGSFQKLICTIMPDGRDIDSMFYLFLTFNPSYNDTISDTICQGQIYDQFGFNETETGFYKQEYQTYLGCDSIINLNLIVKDTYHDTIYADICKGSVYNENGFNEDTTGFYSHPFQSMYGCDSIINLSLIVHEPYFDTIIDTICKGDVYGYGFDADTSGVYTSGVYTQYLKTEFGCDSILVLNLWVNPSYHDTIKAEIYSGNAYTLFGFSETKTGVYEQALKTYLGCDSIIYLDLQVDKIIFPNVVTANGDGINDVFEIHNLIKENAFPENELTVYNRQGKQVYYFKNIKEKTNFWNPNLTNSPEGTYFYRFLGKRPDKTLELNGSVEVIR